MKRNVLFAVAGLAVLAGLAVVTRPRTGRAQDAAPVPFGGAPAGAAGPASPPPARTDINRDIEVTPGQGNWMVCVASYTGPEAPQMARDLVRVLRKSYKLPAYVFNYGAEDRRKEEERKQAYLQQQRQLFEQMRATYGDQVEIGRFRVSRRVVQDQVAVLVGGYPDMDAAHKAVTAIHNLNEKDLKGLKLDQRVFIDPKGTRGEGHLVSPFKAAFVVHNPTVLMERPAASDSQLDLAALRKLNAGEAYSLLECRKPFTLVVAQYLLPAPVAKRGGDTSLLGKLGLGGKGVQDVDPAAVPARSVVEWLRKGNLEAYVLHTRNASIVTLGGYDTLQDPRLSQMKQRWAAANFRNDPRYKMLNLFPEPLPMQVPH
jgi:hypothetical protein